MCQLSLIALAIWLNKQHFVRAKEHNARCPTVISSSGNVPTQYGNVYGNYRHRDNITTHGQGFFSTTRSRAGMELQNNGATEWWRGGWVQRRITTHTKVSDHPKRYGYWTLEGELLNKWHKVVNDMKFNQPIVVSRCPFESVKDETTNYCLYGFCNMSITAYAAVIYLVEQANGWRCSSFVASKGRVVSLKALSIPRLELLFTVLLAWLITNVSGV